MKYVVIKDLGDGLYVRIKSNDDLLCNVGAFLAFDVSDSTKAYFFDWFSSPGDYLGGGELIGLAKEGDVIHTLYLFDETEAHFPILSDVLYDMVVQWLELRKQQSPFVTLFMQVDKFWFRTHNDSCLIDDAIPPR